MTSQSVRASWLVYRSANVVLHILHLSIIGFALTGWLSCRTRAAHLVLIASIFASWVLLAPIKGFGYCFITDMQWKLKEMMGVPVPDGGYMRYLHNKILGREIAERRMDAVTYSVTLLCCAGSVWLSITQGFC